MAKKTKTKTAKPKKITVSRATGSGTVTPVLTTNLNAIDDAFKYLSTISSDFSATAETREKAARDALAAITPELFGAGIFKVQASYNGEGDSGDLDPVYAVNVDGNYMEWPKSVAELRDKVSEILWHFVPAGFEQCDGSQGEITVELSTRKLIRNHQERVVKYDESARSFEF